MITHIFVKDGHLTQTEIKHIKHLLNKGLYSAKINNRKNYYLKDEDNGYINYRIEEKDNTIVLSANKFRSKTGTFTTN